MSITTRYRNLSIKHKLRLVIMVTVSCALMLACATVLVFDQIAAKLKSEAERLTAQLTEKKKEVAKQNREQALPKSFFEQRFMKVKSIRID